MAILMHATLPGVTTEHYDSINAELQALSGDTFAGCISHACVSTDSGLEIFDIWESQEHLDKFNTLIMTVFERLGVTPSGTPPTVSAVHNYWVNPR